MFNIGKIKQYKFDFRKVQTRQMSMMHKNFFRHFESWTTDGCCFALSRPEYPPATDQDKLEHVHHTVERDLDPVDDAPLFIARCLQQVLRDRQISRPET